jgi:hypothetical protein
MTIDWSKFSNIDYWFSGAAGSFAEVPKIDKLSEFYGLYVNTFAVIFVAGAVMNIVSLLLNPSHPLIKKLSLWGTNFSWIGFLGFAWFFLRETSTAFFGARFWAIIGLIWLAVIIGLAIRYFTTFYKHEINFYKKSLNK